MLCGPPNRLHGCRLVQGHAVVVHEQHHISAGLLQHRIHPDAVVQLAVVLGQWEPEMAEDFFLFVRQTGIGSWPVEGMDLSFQGSGLIDPSMFSDGLVPFLQWGRLLAFTHH